MPTRSNIEMTETSVVSLNRPTATFTIPGIEIFKRLRQDDQPHRLRIVQAKAVCSLVLPFRQALPDHRGSPRRYRLQRTW